MQELIKARGLFVIISDAECTIEMFAKLCIQCSNLHMPDTNVLSLPNAVPFVWLLNLLCIPALLEFAL